MQTVPQGGRESSEVDKPESTIPKVPSPILFFWEKS